METVNGFAFPFRLDPVTHGIAWASGPEKLKENLMQILLTGMGERVMRRDYGGGVRELLHNPNDEVLAAIVQHQIASSIAQWEPRVELQSVRLTWQAEVLTATLQYIVRTTQEIQSVAIPINLGGI